jgi:small multidrug resistance pump
VHPLILLAIAIVGEVTATVSLKISDGFTKLFPSVVVIVGYGIAFTALARLLKQGFPVGVAYAIWAAVGVAAVAVIGALFLHEPFNLTMGLGLTMVIGGVLLLELGRTH